MIANQLMRCGASVGANYRAACRARSPAEFRAKLGIVEEEADEAVYWMELLADTELIPRKRLSELFAEANEITAMVVASIRTSRKNEQ
jgi:four helix bundle protein